MSALDLALPLRYPLGPALLAYFLQSFKTEGSIVATELVQLAVKFAQGCRTMTGAGSSRYVARRVSPCDVFCWWRGELICSGHGFSSRARLSALSLQIVCRRRDELEVDTSLSFYFQSLVILDDLFGKFASSHWLQYAKRDQFTDFPLPSSPLFFLPQNGARAGTIGRNGSNTPTTEVLPREIFSTHISESLSA